MKILSLFILSFLIAGPCMSADKEHPVSICEDYDFTCGEVADLSESALSGSAEDAIKMYWSALDKDNTEDAMFWARVAMENGSAIGRHNYASLLSRRADVGSLIRAKFHLKALVSQGDKDAEPLLREVELKLKEKAVEL